MSIEETTAPMDEAVGGAAFVRFPESARVWRAYSGVGMGGSCGGKLGAAGSVGASEPCGIPA